MNTDRDTPPTRLLLGIGEYLLALTYTGITNYFDTDDRINTPAAKLRIVIAILFLAAALLAPAQELPVRQIWKSYPVYHPDKAPPDYIEWLRTQAPEQIVNPTGEELYDAPILLGSLGARPPSDPPFLHDKAWFDKVNPPLTREGAITGYVYILRTKGKIEVGAASCAMCHNRVMPNGTVIKGGQGNFPVDAALAEDLLTTTGNPALREVNKALIRRLFQINGDFNLINAAKLLSGRLPGLMTPPRSAIDSPSQIPDIIGAKIQPAALAKKQLDYDAVTRYSDEQLETLSKYVAALKAPPSPYKTDKVTRQGEKVFEREGCAKCHTTANDKLTGLWRKGVLGHSGTITTLEEWLDPSRLQYSKGHEFGFKLSGTERFALIAFLRTL